MFLSARFFKLAPIALLCVGSVIISATITQIVHAQSTDREITDEERAGARAAATSGIDAFQKGQWQKSIDYLERAEAIIHSPVHLTFMAQAQEELGRLVKAQENYLRVLRDPATGSAADRAKETAQERIEALKPRIPKLTIQVLPKEATDYAVFIDEEVVPASLVGIPSPADPGTRTILVRRGETEVRETIELPEGGEAEVTLELPLEAQKPGPVRVEDSSPTKSNGLKYAAYAALGVGAIGVGAGAVFGLMSNGRNAKGDTLCEKETGDVSCDGLPSDDPIAGRVTKYDDQAGTFTVASVIGFGMGGAGLATGITLLVLSSKSSKREAAGPLRVRPVVAPSYLGVAGEF